MQQLSFCYNTVVLGPCYLMNTTQYEHIIAHQLKDTHTGASSAHHIGLSLLCVKAHLLFFPAIPKTIIY